MNEGAQNDEPGRKEASGGAAGGVSIINCNETEMLKLCLVLTSNL